MTLAEKTVYVIRLQRLVLSSNVIHSIETITDVALSPIRYLKQLALSFNALKSWGDIDRIPLWCPELEGLKLTGNPVEEGTKFTTLYFHSPYLPRQNQIRTLASTRGNSSLQRYLLS